MFFKCLSTLFVIYFYQATMAEDQEFKVEIEIELYITRFKLRSLLHVHNRQLREM